MRRKPLNVEELRRKIHDYLRHFEQLPENEAQSRAAEMVRQIESLRSPRGDGD